MPDYAQTSERSYDTSLEYRFWRLRPAGRPPPFLPLTATNLRYNVSADILQISEAEEEEEDEDELEQSERVEEYKEMLERAVAPSDASSQTEYRKILTRTMAAQVPSSRSRSIDSEDRYKLRRDFINTDHEFSREAFLSVMNNVPPKQAVRPPVEPVSETILSQWEALDGKRQHILEILLQAEQVQAGSIEINGDIVKAIDDYRLESTDSFPDNDARVERTETYLKYLEEEFSELRDSFSELDILFATLVKEQWEIIQSEEHIHKSLGGEDGRNISAEQEDSMRRTRSFVLSSPRLKVAQMRRPSQGIQEVLAYQTLDQIAYSPDGSWSSSPELAGKDRLHPPDHSSYEALQTVYLDQQGMQEAELLHAGAWVDLVRTEDFFRDSLHDPNLHASSKLRNCRKNDVNAVFRSIAKGEVRRPETIEVKKQSRRRRAVQRIIYWEQGIVKHSWLDLCRIAYVGHKVLKNLSIYRLASLWRATWFMYEVQEGAFEPSETSSPKPADDPRSVTSYPWAHEKSTINLDAFDQSPREKKVFKLPSEPEDGMEMVDDVSPNQQANEAEMSIVSDHYGYRPTFPFSAGYEDNSPIPVSQPVSNGNNGAPKFEFYSSSRTTGSSVTVTEEKIGDETVTYVEMHPERTEISTQFRGDTGYGLSPDDAFGM